MIYRNRTTSLPISDNVIEYINEKADCNTSLEYDDEREYSDLNDIDDDRDVDEPIGGMANGISIINGSANGISMDTTD